MPTLLLRLAGPMQSWGVQSRFTHRDTGREPSKSGVIGLLCSALGIDRDDDESLQPLAKLAMGVRVDREGKIERDYQTAGGGAWPGRKSYGVITADGKSSRTVTSDRFYLADAEFLVGLEGEDWQLLERCHGALDGPHWPLRLGRKAYAPGLPVCLPDGLTGLSLEHALRSYPWRSTPRWPRPEEDLRLVFESAQPTTMARYDQPVSFRQTARALGEGFRLRYVAYAFMSADEVAIGGEDLCSTSLA